MNILMISNSPGRGYGYSVVADHVALALQKAGHQVHFLGMQNINPPFRDENGIIILGVRYDGWAGDILEDLLRCYKIDVLLTILDVWLDNCQYIPPLCKKLKIPLVSQITVNSSPLSPFLARFVQQADYIVCPSKFVYNEIISAGFGGDIYNINHGVDTNIFKSLSEEEKNEMKKKLKVEDKEFIAITCMRNKSHLQKDFAALFKAWKICLESIPDFAQKAILICLTDYNEPGGLLINMLRDRTGLTPFIKFIWAKPTKDSLEMTWEGNPEGFLHNANYNFSHYEMTKFYNIADVHIISTFGESANLPTIEALACGTPCIFTACTTGPELVDEPKTGLLADVITSLTTPLISDIFVTDANSLAACIKKMYEDKEFRKECSVKALEFSKNFDWTEIGKKWVELFKKISEDMLKVDYAKGRLGV